LVTSAGFGPHFCRLSLLGRFSAEQQSVSKDGTETESVFLSTVTAPSASFDAAG